MFSFSTLVLAVIESVLTDDALFFSSAPTALCGQTVFCAHGIWAVNGRVVWTADKAAIAISGAILAERGLVSWEDSRAPTQKIFGASLSDLASFTLSA